MDVEVRDESVLIAAMADELDAAVAFDETGQAGLDIVAAAALPVGCANARCEHLVNRRALQDRVSGPPGAPPPPLRNASHFAMSPSGALRPPFDTVIPLSKSKRCSLTPSSVPT